MLKIHDKCLVKVNGCIRIARFNGLGSKTGWGGTDWAGDSGHSTDSWHHDEIEWFLPLDRITVKAEWKEAVELFINQGV